MVMQGLWNRAKKTASTAWQGVKETAQTIRDDASAGWQKTKEIYADSSENGGLWAATKHCLGGSLKYTGKNFLAPLLNSNFIHAISHGTLQCSFFGLLTYLLVVAFNLVIFQTPIFLLTALIASIVAGGFGAYAGVKQNQGLKRKEAKAAKKRNGENVEESENEKSFSEEFYPRFIAFEFAALTGVLSFFALFGTVIAGTAAYILSGLIGLISGGIAAATTSDKSSYKEAKVYLEAIFRDVKELQGSNRLTALLRHWFLFFTPMQAASTLALSLTLIFATAQNPNPFPNAGFWATIGGGAAGATNIAIFKYLPRIGFAFKNFSSWVRNGSNQLFGLASTFVTAAFFLGKNYLNDPSIGGFGTILFAGVAAALAGSAVLAEHRNRRVDIKIAHEHRLSKHKTNENEPEKDIEMEIINPLLNQQASAPTATFRVTNTQAATSTTAAPQPTESRTTRWMNNVTSCFGMFSSKPASPKPTSNRRNIDETLEEGALLRTAPPTASFVAATSSLGPTTRTSLAGSSAPGSLLPERFETVELN